MTNGAGTDQGNDWICNEDDCARDTIGRSTSDLINIVRVFRFRDLRDVLDTENDSVIFTETGFEEEI